MTKNMARKYQKKPFLQTKIAKERISFLFKKADEVFTEDKVLADRYVTLARKISMKFKIRIPSSLKRQFCPHCYKYLRPSVNLRVRLNQSRLVYYCLECKHFWRMPYLKELAERKRRKNVQKQKTS